MMQLQGRFLWSIEYDGKVLDSGIVPNGIITNTIDDLLDVYFSDGTPESLWYLGLISNTNWDEDVGLDDDTDTMVSHAGWEEAENYDAANRPLWSPEVSSDGLKRNAESVDFTITTAEELKGMFVTSGQVKGETAGTLWATAVFPATNTPPVGAVFKLFYELEAREG